MHNTAWKNMAANTVHYGKSGYRLLCSRQCCPRTAQNSADRQHRETIRPWPCIVVQNSNTADMEKKILNLSVYSARHLRTPSDANSFIISSRTGAILQGVCSENIVRGYQGILRNEWTTLKVDSSMLPEKEVNHWKDMQLESNVSESVVWNHTFTWEHSLSDSQSKYTRKSQTGFSLTEVNE